MTTEAPAFPAAEKVTLFKINGVLHEKLGKDGVANPAAIRAKDGEKVAFFVPYPAN